MRKIEDYIDNEIPPSDICIVGSGIAGMEIARSLRDTPLSITILESGYDQFDPRIQQLHQFRQKGHKIRSWDEIDPKTMKDIKSYTPHLRQLSGNSNIWGRRFKFLDEYDFEDKPIYRASTWPISRSELIPYYHAIAKDYNFEEIIWLRSVFPTACNPCITSFPEFKNDTMCRQHISHNVKNIFLKDIERANNITLIKGANVFDITLTEDLHHVKTLAIKSIDGKEFKLKSKLFILACGTIGNTRLLLCSNRQNKIGVGNDNGLVGRNLIDHPKGPVLYRPYGKKEKKIDEMCILNPTPEWNFISEALTYHHYNDKYTNGVTLNPNILRENNLPNHSVEIQILDESMMKKEGEKKKYTFFFSLEQLPNMESRITLTDELDELGMPIPCVDWRFRDEDYMYFRKYFEILQEILGKNKIGTLSYNEQLFKLEKFTDASHQMGTTRMAHSPRDGVTDPNCKVFGIDNLYIAGSSLFPTGGNSHPAFTILALARRLANHIKSIMEN